MASAHPATRAAPASAASTAAAPTESEAPAPAAAEALASAPRTASAPPAGSPPSITTAPLGALRSVPWVAVSALLLAALAASAFGLAWGVSQRVKSLEAELVKRQQESGTMATEARTLARNAELVAREAAARIALLDARVAETSLQRSQFEDLIQSLARSRDENVLADIEAAVRVAVQQTAITGSTEPLVLALRQADERLARYEQPRLERVRRAVVQDLERTRAAGVADIPLLTIRLDEAVRQVDALPLLSAPERRPAASVADAVAPAASEPSASAAAAAAADEAAWSRVVGEHWRRIGTLVWDEVRSLVRITRINQPEAMLVAPEQAFFLRENLKLRLLNARLALLSRQFDLAQSDLQDAQGALDRFFDTGTRRVAATQELVRQVASQARLVGVPRPDATLAAIAAASSGR